MNKFFRKDGAKMTLGEKIKFARQLRGMTQKELGLKVGFSESTADNRIRQYEIGKMKPKADKLELIAEALDVDIDALTDIDIGSIAGNRLPHLLFEMERENGLTVQKVGDQFMMSFNTQHQVGEFYNDALSAWYYARKKYLESSADDKEESLKAYYLWTLKYPFSVMAEEEAISNHIKEKYSDEIANEKKKLSLKTVSDLIKIFEEMSLAKIDYVISENTLFSGFGQICSRIKIPHQLLIELEPASHKAYARFVAAIDYLKDLGQDLEIQTNSYDNISYDDYNILSSAMAPAIIGTVKKMHEQVKTGHFDDPDYQLEYQDDLRQFNIPIEEALNILSEYDDDEDDD